MDLDGREFWRIVSIPIVASLTIASAALLLRSHPFADSSAEDWSYSKTPVVVVESANDFNAMKDAADVTQPAVAAIESELSVFDHFSSGNGQIRMGATNPITRSRSGRLRPSGGAVNDFAFRLAYLPTNEIVWSRTFPQSAWRSGVHGWNDERSRFGGRRTPNGRDLRGPDQAGPRHQPALARLRLRVAGPRVHVKPQPGGAKPCARLPRTRALNQRARLSGADVAVLYPDPRLLRSPAWRQGARGYRPRARAGATRGRNGAYRSETATILFKSRFYARRFDDAFAVVPQLLANLPNSRLVSANVGVAYISRGSIRREGWRSCPNSKSRTSAAPAFSVPMLALAAYMRGDEEAAERFASRAVRPREQPMGLVMRIVVCERQKRQACALEASQQLRQDYPGFAADVPTALFRHALADDIQAKLLTDLRAAGFFD